MQTRTIGVLHPGEMGVTVAASAKNSGCDVYWVSEGRRPQTRERAERTGLEDAGTLAALCRKVEMIVSVCPPANAEELADQVLAAGFRGSYVDANALSPDRKLAMEQRMKACGARFIDGGIIGMPALKPGTTCLSLSGEGAQDVTAYFAAGPIGTEIVGPRVGQASALKMCFAAWNKGMIAMFCSIVGAADRMNVLDDLRRHWANRRTLDFADMEARVLRSAPKAWRWAPEMLEIAATLEESGMEPGFHLAADQLYRRLESFKDTDPKSIGEVLAGLS